VKVENLAKNGEKGQNCYPLSPGKLFFPHLETGDALALKGAPKGVVHGVGFYGDAARKEWRKRLTVVTFYVVGLQKDADARASAVT